MIVYRLCKAKYSHDLTGSGAEKTGGRWNSKGVPMVYTSESRALCIAEIAVHTPLGILPGDYELVSIDLPTDMTIFRIKENEFPDYWKSFPHHGITRKSGDHIIRQNKYLVIKAPSSVVPGDYNYLLNPRHKDSFKIKIIRVEVFDFGKRTFR
jgi:RES domain-containing protein